LTGLNFGEAISAHSEQGPVVDVIPFARRAGSMCDKCQELEKKIERYRTLATRLFDQPTIEAINKLIEEMQAEKAGLHPECN
jgi:hypothetical protein